MQNWLLLLFAVNLFGRLSCVFPHIADDSLTPSVLRNPVLFTHLNLNKLQCLLYYSLPIFLLSSRLDILFVER